ncbi:hypothetical protein BZA77DRAFT_134308 [Pyronema omphalodes]|nr:hypothetical protein BZA77DRAFT_134308 [Pyronema omphalodes]
MQHNMVSAFSFFIVFWFCIWDMYFWSSLLAFLGFFLFFFFISTGFGWIGLVLVLVLDYGVFFFFFTFCLFFCDGLHFWDRKCNLLDFSWI